jgi:SAM-dependent methyltransferase
MAAQCRAMHSDTSDPWLRRWLPLATQHAGSGAVIELGCGSGRDTRTLVQAGLKVIGVDLSAEDIAEARIAVPEAQFQHGDLREFLNEARPPVGLIVASLSLHYFPWAETLVLIEQVRAMLLSGGLLLCRLNSTEDHHYGASGHPRIDDNYFLVEGSPKRFFDQAAITTLFSSGWRMLSMEHQFIDRYEHPKGAWEVVLERADI